MISTLENCSSAVADGKFHVIIILPAVIAAVEAQRRPILLPTQRGHLRRLNG